MSKRSGLLITLMMGAAGTSETSVNFYQTKWRNNPQDSHFLKVSLANLKELSSSFACKCRMDPVCQKGP
jgi:hypothetical protein